MIYSKGKEMSGLVNSFYFKNRSDARAEKYSGEG